MNIPSLTRTWTKITSTGKAVKVTVEMSETAWRSATAEVDGKSYSCSYSGLGLLKPQTINGITYTAAINCYGLGNVALTDAEYQAFRAVLADQDAAMAANPTLHVLVQRRESLAREVGYAIEGAAEGASRRFDLYDTGYRATAKEEAEIAKAQAELAAFDASHPEVLIEIERESNERVERFLAID